MAVHQRSGQKVGMAYPYPWAGLLLVLQLAAQILGEVNLDMSAQAIRLSELTDLGIPWARSRAHHLVSGALDLAVLLLHTSL